jgi:hypothetical protein
MKRKRAVIRLARSSWWEPRFSKNRSIAERKSAKVGKYSFQIAVFFGNHQNRSIRLRLGA